MVKIIFNTGEILECVNVNKIYIENDEIPIETNNIKSMMGDDDYDMEHVESI